MVGLRSVWSQISTGQRPHISKEMIQTVASQFCLTHSISALGMLIQKRRNVVLVCVFGIRQYSKKPQGTCIDLLEQYYVYTSDVVDVEAEIVEIKASFFDIVKNTNVHNLVE